MSRNTPPKYRHDGTSPLPLGMDWSPPPRRWDGNNTIWPHNPQTGWSFCVMVPSWIVQTEPGSSHESFMNPIVFYRIHVGIQSPEGVSTSHGLLRRFSNFLKLYSALKKAFPIKDIPPAPPKHAFLRINSNRLLLEERRHALEDWMGKLLSDIDLSRSAPVANFLELEAAARSAIQYASNHHTESSSSADAPVATPLVVAGHSLNASAADRLTVSSNSPSVASDICSDNADGTSDPGTPRKGQSSLDQPEDFMRGKLNGRTHLVPDREMIGTSSSRDITECISDRDHNKLFGHSRKLSGESMGSDISSIKGSEVSFFGGTNSIWDGSLDVPGGADIANAMDGTQFIDNAQIILPIDQRHKLTRVLVTVQQRLVTAKTDMEDLIVRLNQEMAVKEYLTTKVKDLEVELEASEQRGKENLQQAILIERERVTQMQWDMDELRRKCSEMEAKVKLEQNEKSRAESEMTIANDERELLIQQLSSKQEDLENMRKHLEELELKSKADIKVLVKEVKFLRKSQTELKEMLNQSLKEKTELEGVLCKEKQRLSKAKSANKTLLHECRVLRDRLQECSVNFPMDDQEKFIGNPSSLSDTLDLLETSDNRIGLLLAEAQLLARNDEADELGSAEEEDSRTSEFSESLIAQNGDTEVGPNDEIREILTDMFIDNARLRKQVNSVIRCALNATIKPVREDSPELPTRKTVLNRFLER